MDQISYASESPSVRREAGDHVGALVDIESRQRVKSSAPRKESMVELFGGLCFITNTTASWVFVILAIWGGVGVNVALPLFSDAVGKAGPYFVLLYGSFWFALCFFIALWLLQAFSSQIRPENTFLASTHKNMFSVGLMTSLNGLLIVFASPTTRTPGFLQALLVNITIPMTIGFRYMILGKGVNWKQGLAAFVVMVGIFIALIPNIFYTHSDDANGAQSESAAARILWPLCFMIGFAPGSVQTVVTEAGLKPQELQERTALLQQEALAGEQAVLEGQHRVANFTVEKDGSIQKAAGSGHSKSKNRRASKPRSRGSRSTSVALAAAQPPSASVHLIYFMAWTNLYQFLVNLFLWWADLIPDFGMATTGTFFEGLEYGVKCLAMAAPGCDDGGPMTIAIIFIFAFMFSALANGLLVRQSEGANYVALVGSATTPLAALFWTLFSPGPLRFNPVFTTTTWYSLGGLVCMIPGIIYYNRHSETGGAH